MRDLKVSLIQTNIVWEESKANIENLTSKISNLPPTDIIVLSEMFNTGFSMNQKELAQTMEGEVVSWMKEIAKQNECAICGSLIIVEDDKYYNRFVWVEENGTLHYYDKRHRFSMAKEDEHFSEGTELLTIEYKGWKIRPMICYDLRFPVWSRNRLMNDKFDYDLLIYVANWPMVRKDAWEKLMYARAIENQAYLVGVNGIGKDGNGKEYAGSSAVIDMKGVLLNAPFSKDEKIINQTLEYENLVAFRTKFPVLKDADYFKIIP